MSSAREIRESVAAGQPESGAGDSAAASSPFPAGNEADPRSRYVALLEDDPDQAELVQRWLAIDGLTCRWFSLAEQFYAALERAYGAAAHENGRCDPLPWLVLCDWQLGEVTALDVLGWLNRLSEWQFQVVILSAHTDPARRAAALGAGATAWLTKPLQRDEFLRVVRTTTHRGSG